MSLGWSGCNGSKALVKRGQKFEELGLMSQAANFYYAAVSKDRQNPEALARLQSAGQWVLNDYIRVFEDARKVGNRSNAVAAFESAEAYFRKLEAFDVRLLFPESAQRAYAKVKNEHLSDLYDQGMEALEQEAFAEAQIAFDEVIRLQPDYEDASNLVNVAYCEPRYREAESNMMVKAWRTAHRLWQEVTRKDPDYKDAAVRQKESLDKGQYTIALVGFQNGTNREGMETKFRSHVQQSLSKSTDPFLKVVDRENQAMILQEQQLALSGMLEEGSTVEVGGLLGAKSLLKGNVVECAVVTSNLYSQEKQGFESYRVERINEEGKKVYETKYRSITYREYSRSRQIEITFQLVIISLETGETQLSEMVTQSQSDQIKYAVYNGNVNKVYPAHASGGVSRAGRSRLVSLLKSNRELTAESVMINQTVENASEAIRLLVENEIKRLVP